MAYGDVKTKYGKGILKEYWDHIVSVAASCGKATLLSNMPDVSHGPLPTSTAIHLIISP